METLHPEEGSTPGTRDPHEQYAECPINGCGEFVSLAGMDYHIDLHVEEQQDSPDSSGDQVTTGAESSISSLWPGNDQSTVQGLLLKQQGDAIQQPGQLPPIQPARSSGTKSATKDGEMRLGVGGQLLSTPMINEPDTSQKAELGKYAHEQQMPSWLISLLHKGGEVASDGSYSQPVCFLQPFLTLPGVITVLGQLLHQSRSTEYSYLCHPAVQHISKLKKEGRCALLRTLYARTHT